MNKIRLLRVSLWLILTIIFIRLVQFQVIEHRYLLQKATYNFLKEYKIHAPRGKIYDRNGILLASWKPAFRIMAIPKFLKDEDYKTLQELLGNLPIDPDTLKNKGNYVQIKGNLSYEETIKLLEKSINIKSIVIDADPVRVYTPYGKYAAHLIGYVSEASKEEIKRFNLDPGDFIGKAGVERSFDSLLRGQDGARFIALDSRGHVVSLNPRPPEEPAEGEEIFLTIDIKLQALLDSLFEKYPRGAAFGMNIKTGEVIIFYSKPYFNPESLITRWTDYVSDKEKPLLNRVLQGLYPPGSTFKLITTLVGLYTGTLKENTAYYCPGGFTFGIRTWLCWRTEGHGSLNLIEAIAQSCNVYFNNVGARIGTNKFIETLDSFNLPEKTGIDLIGEYTVLIPTSKLLKNRLLLPSSVINWSIGQGEIQVTPAWMALVTGLIAGNGKCPKPIVRKGDKPKYLYLNLPQEYFEIVKEGMRMVVESPQGTTRYLYDPSFKIAGKTGTAQNPHGREHSWFTCFFPYDDPTYVLTVVVENAGHGSMVAAPIAINIAKRIMNEEK